MQKNIKSKEIIKKLEYLKSRLPIEPTADRNIYQLPKQYIVNAIQSNLSEKSIQEIADHIGIYLCLFDKVKVSVIELKEDGRWVSADGMIIDPSSINISGLYRVLDQFHSKILIFKRPIYRLYHILAILAHESVHNCLGHYNIKLQNEEENEILTDLAISYLGLGHFIIKGYEPIVWIGDQWSNFTGSGYTRHCESIGYINVKTVKKSIILATKMRNWGVLRLLTGLSFENKVVIIIRLLPYLIKEIILNFIVNRRSKIKKRYIDKLNNICSGLHELNNCYMIFCDKFNNCKDKLNYNKIHIKDGKAFVEIASSIFNNEIGNNIKRAEHLIEKYKKDGATKSDIDSMQNSFDIITKQLKYWENILEKNVRQT